MSVDEKIEGLSGIGDIYPFFGNNQIEKFSEVQLRKLCIRLATLNGKNNLNLDAFFQIAYNALESKRNTIKFWIPIILSVAFSLASLIVSIVSLKK